MEITRWLEDRGTIKNVGLHRTWKLFTAMSVAGHWCACVFFYISKTEAQSGSRVTWAEADGLYERGEVRTDDASRVSSPPPPYLTLHSLRSS